MRKLVPSMLVGAPHENPLYVRALPLPSTAAQKDADGQETATSLFVPSMLTGAVQALPLNVSARPEKSTTAQNDAAGHDNLSDPPPRTTGAVQELPLYVTAKSVLSSAAQKDEDAHDTDLRPCAPPTRAGALHTLPSYFAM